MADQDSQTPAESRNKAKAPVVDELQAKREDVAEKGMAHASMNGGQPVKPSELSEAEVVGDDVNLDRPDTRPGTSDASSVEDVPKTESPSSEKTTEGVEGGNNAEESNVGQPADGADSEPSQNQVDENESTEGGDEGEESSTDESSEDQTSDESSDEGTQEGSEDESTDESQDEGGQPSEETSSEPRG